jgi:hypothetical protein
MKHNIAIVRIAEGLGNQLFMFCNAFSLAKSKKYQLLIDNESGYFKNKNQLRKREYLLQFFNIKNDICSDQLKFNNYFKDTKRKLLKIIDCFKSKKTFLIEHRDNDKKTYFKNIKNYPLNKIAYLEGHFESEKYFSNNKDELKEILTIKNKYINYKNKYISLITKKNSVSIHIRKHKFSEEILEAKKKENILKSDNFSKESILYAQKAIKYFKKKIKNPTFFIWSNDFSGLEYYFKDEDCVFVKNNNVIMDFYLFSLCKHFAVGGSTFHWMGAWLNTNKNKLCVRPKDNILNPSKNLDFWPSGWIKL